MQWTEVAPDVWVPFDLEKREAHSCWQRDANKFTIDSVMDELDKLGYEAYVPRTSTWQTAFAATNETQSILFLIRKHGIDFKLYDSPETFEVDDKGKLYTGGGEIIRNYYNESGVFIFEWIWDIASRFITNTPIENTFLVSQGKPWAFNRARYIRSTQMPEDGQGNRELKEIYDAISVGDGVDAYLGDGIWIGSNGSWHDRGR